MERNLGWNHKYDFRPKLHDTRFNDHFITSILKSPKYETLSIQIFYWCSSEPVFKQKEEPETLLHLILYAKQKDFYEIREVFNNSEK